MSVYIYDAVRTVRGKAKPDGGLASQMPEDLVAAASGAIAERNNIKLSPDMLILGAVGQVGAQGGNIALVSKFRAGLPDETAAFCLNNYCTSGLTAVGQAAAMVSAGHCQGALAGGVEMMSRVPFMGDQADYYTNTTLPQRTLYLPVALAADRLAEDIGVSREDMDEAAASIERAEQVVACLFEHVDTSNARDNPQLRFEHGRVPEPLLGGNHAEIRRWRLKQALGRTWLRRPDLLQVAGLDAERQALLDEFIEEYKQS